MKRNSQRISEIEDQLFDIVSKENNVSYDSRIKALQRKVYSLEHPAEFKKLDEVKFVEAKAESHLYGAFTVTDIELRQMSAGQFEWRYSVINKETGVERVCVPEFKLWPVK